MSEGGEGNCPSRYTQHHCSSLLKQKYKEAQESIYLPCLFPHREHHRHGCVHQQDCRCPGTLASKCVSPSRPDRLHWASQCYGMGPEGSSTVQQHLPQKQSGKCGTCGAITEPAREHHRHLPGCQWCFISINGRRVAGSR